MTSRLLALALSATLSVAAGCAHHPMPSDQAIAALHAPEAKARQGAADALRTPEGVPADAVPALLAAYAQEQDRTARGAILIALGWSGAEAAKPVIDEALQSARRLDEKRWATRAQKYWMLQNGELEANTHARYWFPWGGTVTPTRSAAE